MRVQSEGSGRAKIRNLALAMAKPALAVIGNVQRTHCPQLG
jgi:UDP-N-acetylmuramyl pentapeptide synthase